MYGFKVLIEGDYACFTRPEMKVERVSYDVPTPGALEGLLKCIYWKPAIRYVIDKIIVFNPIEFLNVRRNEVKNKVSYKNLKKKMLGEDSDPSIVAHTSNTINQRGSMILKNVKYGIEFHFEMTGIQSDQDDTKEKHFNVIKRRLERGQSFKQPYFGNREYSIKSIELVKDEFDKTQISETLKGERDLGYMLYGVRFKDGGIPKNNNWEKPLFHDDMEALYYRVKMKDGIIDVKKLKEDIRC